MRNFIKIYVKFLLNTPSKYKEGYFLKIGSKNGLSNNP